MKIFVNDEPREISAPMTLEQFMDGTGMPSLAGVAIAVDETVVPRQSWRDCVLAEGARLLVIQAAQGG
ncbi:MAG: sulfur carrier protein ThiS [Puniceicoccales bacterium]|jgi:sulfur carrier protein|nr:sulfur carrier protein ThiS [Puniceicoccales bacterium]